ncbi:hypothetical protein [Nocardioides sp. URHA0020]|uniref:hypothetical protein n=1 Tax=Nocardioides sp. URHA0020 TaxID=1380392 RepID=UPI00048E5450|nr:hypothetical protein [Nocardioides sp. URHA0020]
MADRHLVGTNGRIELTLDGLTFRRTKAEAESRGVRRVHSVDWGDISAATLVRSGKGKPVIQVQVSDAGHGAHHVTDPYAVKVKRSQEREGREFVDLVNFEIDTRRRWDEAAAQGA